MLLLDQHPVTNNSTLLAHDQLVSRTWLTRKVLTHDGPAVLLPSMHGATYLELGQGLERISEGLAIEVCTCVGFLGYLACFTECFL